MLPILKIETTLKPGNYAVVVVSIVPLSFNKKSGFSNCKSFSKRPKNININKMIQC